MQNDFSFFPGELVWVIKHPDSPLEVAKILFAIMIDRSEDDCGSVLGKKCNVLYDGKIQKISKLRIFKTRECAYAFGKNMGYFS
jgi:hypothetical protein